MDVESKYPGLTVSQPARRFAVGGCPLVAIARDSGLCVCDCIDPRKTHVSYDDLLPDLLRTILGPRRSCVLVRESEELLVTDGTTTGGIICSANSRARFLLGVS